MGSDGGRDVDGSQLVGPDEGESRPIERSRTRAPRRLVGLLIAAVIVGDLATIIVRRDREGSRQRAQASADSVLFRDDFAAGSTFFARTSEDSDGVENESFRMTTKNGADHYVPLPPEAPSAARVLQTRDIGVAVDVKAVPGDPNTWFGVFCRSEWLGGDTYVGSLSPDGTWTVNRNTLGTEEYVERVLAGGKAPALENPQGDGFVARLRLDCVGQVPTSLVLSVNDTVVGMATDPEGLAPARIGMVGSSTAGLVFDNLVVTEIA